MSRILITDDNSDYRQSVIEVLRLEGYEVMEAADGAQAVDFIRAHVPDLILCDLDMPKMNGFQVLETIKADPALQEIPFFLVTGHDEPDTIARGKQLGADDYMVKPMNIDLLLSKIDHFLAANTQPPVTE